MYKNMISQNKFTIGILCILLVFELLMEIGKVGYMLNIGLDIVLCVFFNIYNYRKFNQFQSKKDIQLTNQRLGFALLFINLFFIIHILIIVIRIY
jgi:hypothetical protein